MQEYAKAKIGSYNIFTNILHLNISLKKSYRNMIEWLIWYFKMFDKVS